MGGSHLKVQTPGAWVAQLVKRLILDFNSGHDLTVCAFKPRMGFYTDSVEPAWDSLSAPPLLTLALCLSFKVNK